MEYLRILRAWRARATGDTSSKKTNHYAIKKPLAEELTHIHGSTRHDHQQAAGTRFFFSIVSGAFISFCVQNGKRYSRPGVTPAARKLSSTFGSSGSLR